MITTENWDGVTAPSIAIGGWTVQTGWTTETSVYYSSPNGIGCTPSGYLFLTYDTQDGNSGDVSATTKFYLDDSSSGDTAIGVASRGSADPLDVSSSFYAAEVESDRSFAGTWKIRLLKRVSGSETAIASLTGLSGLPDGGWYQLTLTASGSSLSATLVRLSDGYYLQTGGTWAATAAHCLTATDSSITGQGYAGIYAHGIGLNFNAIYVDDFELDTAAPITVITAFDSATIDSWQTIFGRLVAMDQCSVHDGFSLSYAFAIITAFDSSASLAEVTALSGTVFTIDSASILDMDSMSGIVVAFDSFSVNAFNLTIPIIVTLDAISVEEGYWTSLYVGIYYSVYGNDGAGGPINYFGPVVTALEATTWTTDPLAYPGHYKFGVRAYDAATGLEEKNLSATVEIILDGSGVDITNRPFGPVGLRVVGLKGGAARLEWSYPKTRNSVTGFHVYYGTSGSPDYGTIVKTVAYVFGYTKYSVELGALTNGATYTIGVRAYNATAEETNTNTVQIAIDATGPTAVLDLTADATQ